MSVVELLPKSGVGGWLLFRSCARFMREGRLLWRCYPWSVGGDSCFFGVTPRKDGGGNCGLGTAPYWELLFRR